MTVRLSKDGVLLRQYTASVRASRVTRNCMRCGDEFKTNEAFRMCPICRNCDAAGGMDFSHRLDNHISKPIHHKNAE